MLRKTYLSLLLSLPAAAQQVAAPTPETVGSARGQNVSNYNVVNSWETGYRFASIGGSEGRYRSVVNYGNGVRLLGARVTVNSLDGHGQYFDQATFSLLGLGGDPYETAMLRVEKNRLYRYEMLWRRDDLFNPARTISLGEHFLNTTRRMQDHDVVFLPQSRLRFRLGYSRNSQDGAALTTTQLFDARGDEFPLFADLRRTQNEYRAGLDLEMKGFRFSLLHRWDYWKEDTPYRLDGLPAGNNAADATALTRFSRVEPFHGASPAWLGNLHGERKNWALDARLTYVGSRRRFALDESAAGTARFGPASRQVLVTGDARRPATAGDFSFSYFPGERLTIVNSTSVYSNRTDGNAAYVQFDNSSFTADTLFFQFLGIRTVSNATDLNYRLSPRLGVYSGYHFSNRRIRAANLDVRTEQENTLHSGLFGVRFSPVKPLAVNLEGEIGRADGPFTPVSERNYHALRGRVEYRRRTVQAGVNYRQHYNNNSVALSVHSMRSRQYGANLSWTPRDRFALEAGYVKLHLDTISGLAFFVAQPGPTLLQGRQSVYLSNVHAGNFGAHFGVTKRVDFYAGYTITKDAGDGRAAPLALATSDAVTAVLAPVQVYPLTYHSPLARLSVRLMGKVRWNAGWQFYSYHEQFGLFALQHPFRAHTGYTSLLWAF